MCLCPLTSAPNNITMALSVHQSPLAPLKGITTLHTVYNWRAWNRVCVPHVQPKVLLKVFVKQKWHCSQWVICSKCLQNICRRSNSVRRTMLLCTHWHSLTSRTWLKQCSLDMTETVSWNSSCNYTNGYVIEENFRIPVNRSCKTYINHKSELFLLVLRAYDAV